MVESRIVEGVYKRFSVPHDNVDESNYYIPPIVRPTKFFYRELKETEKKMVRKISYIVLIFVIPYIKKFTCASLHISLQGLFFAEVILSQSKKKKKISSTFTKTRKRYFVKLPVAFYNPKHFSSAEEIRHDIFDQFI